MLAGAFKFFYISNLPRAVLFRKNNIKWPNSTFPRKAWKAFFNASVASRTRQNSNHCFSKMQTLAILNGPFVKIQCEVPKHKNETTRVHRLHWNMGFTYGSPHKLNQLQNYIRLYSKISEIQTFIQRLPIVFDNFRYIRVFRLEKSLLDLSCILY